MKFKLNILFIILVAFLAISCGKDDDDNTNNPPSTAVNSCEGCHTNYEHLKKVYTPDSIPPAGGCSGEAIVIEPYDRVYMGGKGYQEFKESEHYEQGCVGCHNGVDGTDDKKTAHSGNFLPRPSHKAEEKCKSCHADEVNRHKNSIHNGWGQQRKVCVRAGVVSEENFDATSFDKLPAEMKKGYERNCSICHASCGECHVNRPHEAGGGLMAGHKFNDEPDMVETCVKCHTSRGGHAYLGVAPGTQPDVHFTKKGFKCTSCHSKNELHGNGEFVEQRYAYNQLPKCVNCHSSIATSNSYHTMHASGSYKLDCQVCHSQDYNNCGSCHIGGAGARMSSHQSFKIAMNPIPNVKKGYKFALVRRTLMAPDSWKEYGMAELSQFDKYPIFNYTTPHNILRWTTRTKVAQGGSCSDNCHIRKENDVVKNKELYLFQNDLKLPWEKSSTNGFTVDGKLPSSWIIE